MSDALDRLADVAGIEPTFADYFGNETRVSDATKRALLAAMGYDVASETRIARALADARDAQWTRIVPAVTVVRAGERIEIACAFEEGTGTAYTWTLVAEDGTEYSGSMRAEDAPGIEEGTAGGRRFTRRRVWLTVRLPLGYHCLRMACGAAQSTGTLIVTPPACFVLPEMEDGRVWALATQLYALRSQRNWGIGDFSDLAELSNVAAAAGAVAIAINPLHALFPSNPWAASPYAPSSRLFLNVMYVDAAAVVDAAESAKAQAMLASPEFAADLDALRDGELVDYAGIARAKLPFLRILYESFCTNHLERPGDVRAGAFRAFVRDGGERLERLARYEALAEHFRARDAASYGWMQWPSPYRDADSTEVAAFARTHRARVDFYLYLQWLADDQLARAASTARRQGVGLYRDLAVGIDRNGADAWSDPAAIAAGASLGAPADPLNTEGQNWGLPPLSPRALRERAYAPFVALLRANMRHARILRIDHVMALRRAFWIPHGKPASDGAYVRYPFEDMLGILTLESVRNACAVVGEDLGTLPEGFRERLRDARALSSRLLYFEREWDGTFRAPGAYPRVAAASIGTHDLPPLAGWWTDAAGNDREARVRLIDALVREGCLDADGAQRLREDLLGGGTRAVADALSAAVHRFLARTPSMLAVVAIEDVLGETGGVNVPGTIDQHPNWRRKRSLPLEALAADGRLFRIGGIMGDTTMTMPEHTE